MTTKRFTQVTFFLAAFLPCLAQSPAGAQIDGIVVDAITGAPVRRAAVQLRFAGASPVIVPSVENADYAAVTGPDGTFHFEQLPAGNYSLSYSRTSYLQMRSAAAGYSPRIVRVAAGQAVKGLRYGMIPQAVVSGRVVDDEGDPVEGVQVSLLAFRYSTGIRRMVRLAEAGTTNDRGEYRVPRIAPGKYFLQASLDRLPPGSSLLAASRTPGAPLVTYASTFYPGVVDPGQAIRVELNAGQELGGIDIPLQRTSMVRVSGRAMGADGAPLPHAMILLLSAQSRLVTGFGAPADAAGNFTLNNVRSGSYILSAVSGNTSISVPLEAGSTDIAGFVAQASPPVSVHGSVTVDDAGRNFSLTGVNIFLRLADSGAPLGSTRPAADGSFRLDNLPAGRYIANVNCGAPSAYVQSITAGGEELLGRDFDLSAAASGLRIAIRTDAATLNGTVEPGDGTNGKGGGQGRSAVILIPVDVRMRGVDTIPPAPVSAKNSFESRGLRPGDYLAIAFDDVDETQLQDPEFVASLEPMGTRVQLTPGATQSITLKLNAWPQTAAGN